MDHAYSCPVQATSKALAGKWKVQIVWHLSNSSYRFSELRTLLPGVSEKVLTAQLRELERDGILQRLDARTVPPRVDYMLGDAGKELIPVMQAMCDWGAKHFHLKPTLVRPANGMVNANMHRPA